MDGKRRTFHQLGEESWQGVRATHQAGKDEGLKRRRGATHCLRAALLLPGISVLNLADPSLACI